MIPTELLGSLPRSQELLKAVKSSEATGKVPAGMGQLQLSAVQQAIIDLEKTGSTLLTDGEQSKPSYLTYAVAGLKNVEPDGAVVQYIDGHGRRLPRLTKGPFSYNKYAGDYVYQARKFTAKPLKQAVISPASMFLMYPKSGIEEYPPNEFLEDVIGQSELDLRSCLGQNCSNLQIDAPELSMSIGIDSRAELLQKFIAVNNVLLDRFVPSQRLDIGVHICSGCDQGSSLCTEAEYCELLKEVFKLHTDKLYLPLEKFKNKDEILQIIHKYKNPWNKLYIGVVDVRPGVPEPTPEQIIQRIQRIARYIPLNQLGTTDDCGFASFADTESMSRRFALNSITARVQGTARF
ncbi:hypothetical protein GJ496_002525 [Pomphorhynchus laevis]|nr:hypothetical protein GJ496_002525 [Pomphorhynchus laevis]